MSFHIGFLQKLRHTVSHRGSGKSYVMPFHTGALSKVMSCNFTGGIDALLKCYLPVSHVGSLEKLCHAVSKKGLEKVMSCGFAY